MTDLVKDPFSNLPDAKIPTATNMIYQYIADQVKPSGIADINRASSMPSCPKQRWYKKNGHSEGSLPPRTQMNFMLGHIAETVVLDFIKNALVGPGKLYSEIDLGLEQGSFHYLGRDIAIYTQRTLVADVAGFKVTAHLDGMGKRNSDGKWEIIEVKSASDYGFDSFVEDGPADYLAQAHACMKTDLAIEREVTQTRYFYLKKSTGHIWDRLISFDEDVWKDVCENIKIANGEAEPKRPYVPIEETFRSKPTGRKKLHWRCSYCFATEKCWPEAKLEFKNNKPIWLIEPEEKKNEV